MVKKTSAQTKCYPALPIKTPAKVYKELSERLAISPQTVRAVLEGFSEYTVEQLSEGNTVQIPSFHFILGVRRFSERAIKRYNDRGFELPHPVSWYIHVKVSIATKALIRSFEEKLEPLLGKLK